METSLPAIRRLDMGSDYAVLELLELQLSAYKREVEQSGVDSLKLPPPMDSIRSIRTSKEIFWGCYLSGQLAGAVSYTLDSEILTICYKASCTIELIKGFGLVSFVKTIRAD